MINSNINVNSLIQQGTQIKHTNSNYSPYDVLDYTKWVCSILTYLKDKKLDSSIQYTRINALIDAINDNGVSENTYKTVMGALQSCKDMYPEI